MSRSPERAEQVLAQLRDAIQEANGLLKDYKNFKRDILKSAEEMYNQLVSATTEDLTKGAKLFEEKLVKRYDSLDDQFCAALAARVTPNVIMTVLEELQVPLRNAIHMRMATEFTEMAEKWRQQQLGRS